MKTLVLGLGNELIADDAVGIFAARELKNRIGDKADVIETSLHGVALMEFFIGYDRAIIVDAIRTGVHPPGTIMEFDSSELVGVFSPSPHYSGLSEIFILAREMELEFPSEVTIVAVEAEDVLTIGGGMTEAVRAAFPELLERVENLIKNESHQN
ncbi:MAG: hydrogenase maturation protease [bacterium]